MCSAGAQADCLFCRMASSVIDVPKVLENDDLFVIRDINPRAPVHLLVIPKQHIPTVLDVAAEHGPLLAKLFAAARQAGEGAGLVENGCRIAFNVGRDSGMTVWHLHMHVLGGRALGPEG